MKRRILIPLFLLLAILPACASAKSQIASDSAMAQEAPLPAAEALMADETSGKGADSTYRNTTNAEAPDQSNRLVIKNATIQVVVRDPTSAMDQIGQMAEEMGGYVVSSNLYKTTTSSGIEVPEASITIRVLANRLDDALARIKAMVEDPGTDVLVENVSGQDVTKEYTDLQSRLTNLEKTEEGLQKLLDRATSTEDILAVYNQLVSTREQIEVIKGQIKYYEESAALSMVSVTLRSKASVEPITVAGWQPVGVARDALQATLSGLKFLVNAAIWLALFALPIGVLVYLPIRLVIWLVRRSRKNQKPAPKATPPAVPPVEPPGDTPAAQ